MEPSKEAASAGPVMTMENGGQVLDTIDRLKAKEKNVGRLALISSLQPPRRQRWLGQSWLNPTSIQACYPR